jgi:hypothetical protein
MITIRSLRKFRSMKHICIVILMIVSFSAVAQKTEIKNYSFRSNPKKPGAARYTVAFYQREDKKANTLVVDSIHFGKEGTAQKQVIKKFEMEPHHPSYIEFIDSDPHFDLADFNFDSLLDLRLVRSTGETNRNHHYWIFNRETQTLQYDTFLSELTSAKFDANEKTASSVSSLGYQRYWIVKYRLINNKWTTVETEKMEWIEERKKYRQTIETLMPDGSWQTEVSETDN